MNMIDNMLGLDGFNIEFEKHADDLNNTDAAKSRIISKYVFDSYFEAKFNHVALFEAFKIAEKLHENVKPYCVYGDAGMGKTHLLNAIGNAVLKNNPENKVMYTKGIQLSEELISSILENNTENVRRKYLDIDLLLIDDIHKLCTKPQVQEEIINIIDDREKASKHLVVSCNCAPNEIDGFSERLIEMLTSGTVVKIETPSLEEKNALLRAICKREGINITLEALKYIACNVGRNIRELLGALIMVVSYAELLNTSITTSLVADVLNKCLNQGTTDDYLLQTQLFK